MTDRRYDDDEVAAIFAAATESLQSSPEQPPTVEGHTLAELQAIGSEVGISPEAVARAAQTIDVRRAAVSRTFLGLPIGVERSAVLHRRLTDEEWERFVVKLREVFKARGRMRSEGSLRQWTNGNLYALLEPIDAGYRLRVGSRHGAAIASLRIGTVALGAAAVLAIAGVVGIPLADTGAIAAFFAGGLALVANGALRLSGWARLRGRQMEGLVAHLALPPEE